MSTGHVVSRSVRDSARMMDCTHGPAPDDPYAVPVPARPFADEVGADPGKLRIALMTDGFDGRALDPECIKGMEKTAKLCADLGHDVEPALPKLDVGTLFRAARTVIAGNVQTPVRLRCKALGREPSGQDVEAITWAFAQEDAKSSAGGMPLGIHFGAPFGDEATLFRLAAQLEAAAPGSTEYRIWARRQHSPCGRALFWR